MSATQRWLAAARATDDPAGDTIADMRSDSQLPKLFRNIGEMRAYLIAKRACRECIETLPIVWRRYRQWLDRNPFECASSFF